MLDRLRDSFVPDDERALALRDEVCQWIEAIHGVEGVARYFFGLEELEPGRNGEHTQGFEVLVSTQALHPVLAGIHELGHVLDAVF